MAAINYCPACQKPWHHTAEGWEYISGQGQHFKGVQQVRCPECARKDTGSSDRR
jgi:endogenous inhibitor of DNA gyrase (YacG/DUF329 family)